MLIVVNVVNLVCIVVIGLHIMVRWLKYRGDGADVKRVYFGLMVVCLIVHVIRVMLGYATGYFLLASFIFLMGVFEFGPAYFIYENFKRLVKKLR